MPDSTELREYYRSLTDQQLLNLRAEGGFTAEAEQVICDVMAQRRLGSHDVKRFVDATERGKLREEVVERGGGYRWPGLEFFGKDFENESDRTAGILVRTKWFTMSGIPLVPLASYRFHAGSKSDPTKVINRIPLYWPQVFMTYMKTAAIIVGAMVLIVCLAELWPAIR